MAGLPEGFTIDQPPGGPGGGGPGAPGGPGGLPPGFTIDAQGAPGSPWDAFTDRAPGEIKPDIGPPAIGSGAEEFSPGMPAVNQEVDRIAQSANRNLIEPVKHPIDTAMGIGSVGAGLAQYAGQGALGTGFEPDVDALAADYKRTYGSMEGFKNALINDPVRVAMDASGGLGILRGLGRRAGLVSRPAGHIEAPSVQELQEASQGHYRAMKGLGVELHPDVMDNVATNIVTELEGEGHFDFLAPKTHKAVERLRDPPGQFSTINDIEAVRKALNKVRAGPDAIERDAANRAIGHIDDALSNLDPADVAVNPHFAPRVAQEAQNARANYAAFKQAEAIEQARSNAELQAASTGSGANIDNATRQKYRAIVTNPRKMRGYSPEEQQAMREIVQGSVGGNAARLVGKLAPSGIVSATLSGAIGHAVGHSVATPTLGYIAKQIADASTARKAARASELRRLRSPLARQIGAVPNPGRVPPIGTAMQLGRLPAYTNPYTESER